MDFQPLEMGPIQWPVNPVSVAAVVGAAAFGILVLGLTFKITWRRLVRRERSPLRILGRWIGGLLG